LQKLEKKLHIQAEKHRGLEYETATKERELWRLKSESMYGLIVCMF
jgi:hypothetical protein